MESIEAYNKEIDSKEKALAALNKRQFELMLAQDAVGMSELDKDIADAEKQRGNQLTQGDSRGYNDEIGRAHV